MRFATVLALLFVVAGHAHADGFRPSELDPYLRLGITDSSAVNDEMLDRLAEEAKVWVEKNIAATGRKRALEKINQAIQQLRQPEERRRLDGERARRAKANLRIAAREALSGFIDSHTPFRAKATETIRNLGSDADAANAVRLLAEGGVSSQGLKLLFEMVISSISPAGEVMAEDTPDSALAAENASLVIDAVNLSNVEEEVKVQMRKSLWDAIRKHVHEEAERGGDGETADREMSRHRDMALRRTFSKLSSSLTLEEKRSFLMTIVDEPDGEIREDLLRHLRFYLWNSSDVYTALIPALSDPSKRHRAREMLKTVPRKELPQEVQALLPKRSLWCWVLETFWY